MNKLIATVPTIYKALVAFLIPQVPAIIAIIQRDYGTAAGAEAVAVATSLGVYRVPNQAPTASAPAAAGEPGVDASQVPPTSSPTAA